MIMYAIYLATGLAIMAALIGLACLAVMAHDDFKHRREDRDGPDSRG